MPNIHQLKSWQPYWQGVNEGRKTFEIRRDDRVPPFEVGDLIKLVEVDAVTLMATGSWCAIVVTYVMRDAPQFGLMPGFAILGFKLHFREVGENTHEVIPL